MDQRKHLLSSLSVNLLAFIIAARRTNVAARKRIEALRPQGTGDRSPGNTPALDRIATSPEEIPPKGWWDIAKRTAGKFSKNELMSEAASVTFFALLSLFPAITALVSIYGLFTDPRTIQTHLDAASGFLPSGGMEIISDQIIRLTQTPASGLSFGAVAGVLAAVWSANQGAKAMFSALNNVYGEEEERSFLKKTALSLAFTASGIACLLLALGAIVLLPVIFNRLGLSTAFDATVKLARWPIILIGVSLALSVLYWFGPNRNPAKWKWVTWGGTIAAVLWIAFSAGFSWYVEHFGSYNKTYGSLGAIIGFMTWIWLSSTVLLLGAQINAEMETQVASDTTTGRAKARGSRGAAAADTLN